MLYLNKNCHATLIDNRPSYLGMLRKSRNYITWGEPTKEKLSLLIKRRGRLEGNKKITDDYAKDIGYKSLDNLIESIYDLEVEYKNLPKIKPVFRLHPPKKGFKGKIKRSFAAGGVSGYRGEAINRLIKDMS
jgi:large subunit ribosomal protein L30